ncbi:MAG: M56 family metallopeptidase, partial [Gemmatimonadaceae bacterium]
MIAAWMIETTLVALLFAGGAAVAQRVFALYRGVSLRWIWAAAIAATLAISVLWLAPHAATPVGVMAAAGSSVGAVVPANRAPEFHLPAVSAATERGLIAAWIAASSALAGVLLFAFVRLGWEGRGWENGEVGGTAVNISDSLGPAAVGMLRPRVVLPRWVLALDEMAQRAIVAHEREHQRRRDPALLVAGLMALVLMPWNVGMWLSWRGLRLAVEFDCDERVLRRGIDRAGYAQILLGAWGQTRA